MSSSYKTPSTFYVSSTEAGNWEDGQIPDTSSVIEQIKMKDEQVYVWL